MDFHLLIEPVKDKEKVLALIKSSKQEILAKKEVSNRLEAVEWFRSYIKEKDGQNESRFD